MIPKKLNLDRVTAVCIDGGYISEERKNQYIRIFNHMNSVSEFYDFIFVSVDGISCPGVRNVKVFGFDIGGYSSYCVKKLNDIIESDFCLIFQLDGFIINPHLWDNEFYNYDYIGAPWPLYFGGWVSEGNQVGNGGFSLRSKKLLKTTSELPDTRNHEDTYIVFEKINELNKNEIKIAPVEVAMRFSVENPINDEHNIDTCFGFHSKSILRDALINKIRE